MNETDLGILLVLFQNRPSEIGLIRGTSDWAVRLSSHYGPGSSYQYSASIKLKFPDRERGAKREHTDSAPPTQNE